ncbi:hypothetical protein NL532_15835 [Mesorhizobium sp. C120A]|uniref:hypothetical protein n=1 Tax=unclassified Mesorhizobium TaxID=325217 RepID=UPI0003CFFF5E|nr:MULTISPECIES: hypothetical protein [unclassified Mesorhizobium]ESZ55605.1 hypothetical protein X728_28925 [Mesorhizobium sp. L103C120A0]WJI47995.1 hypothetical protein NL532_15835 [Mesorhizobium sp. C120A]
MKIQQVFTPNDIPTVTYVDRADHKLEQKLRDNFNTPNMIISVSGPSKSGKTVLVKKVIPEEELISVNGATINSPDDLWEKVLSWMGAASETTVSDSTSNEISSSVSAGGKLKVPFVAEGGGQADFGGSRGWGSDNSKTYARNGLQQVIKEIAGSSFAVFIDDFHYINPAFRDEIGRQIKAAAESGVHIVTASVPHRADDVVRSNPELRGRVAAIDLAYWTQNELQQIAQKGFSALNVELAPKVERHLAAEAFGSPQLMQAICLNLGFEMDVRETREDLKRVDVGATLLDETLLRTSSLTDFSTMLTSLHTGPRIRGTERKEHDFIDGSKGDVYRSILLAIAKDPAELALPYDKILARVREVCLTEPPVGSSITSALEQMQGIAASGELGSSPLSWDGDALTITDPYFLFFLRASNKLLDLAPAKSTGQRLLFDPRREEQRVTIEREQSEDRHS